MAGFQSFYGTTLFYFRDQVWPGAFVDDGLKEERTMPGLCLGRAGRRLRPPLDQRTNQLRPRGHGWLWLNLIRSTWVHQDEEFKEVEEGL